MGYPFESAVVQWEEGWRRLQEMGEPQRRRADRLVEALRDELRRRVGAAYTTTELADCYGQGTDWCMHLATEIAPALLGEAQALADAAFWLHLRGAVDFAGGRRLSV